MACTDPMNLFRGLLMVNNAADPASVSKPNTAAGKTTSYDSGLPFLAFES